jgi:hypothetical protein
VGPRDDYGIDVVLQEGSKFGRWRCGSNARETPFGRIVGGQKSSEERGVAALRMAPDGEASAGGGFWQSGCRSHRVEHGSPFADADEIRMRPAVPSPG